MKIWVAVIYSAVLFSIVAAIAYLVWDRPDPKTMCVPVPILVWAFVGGMASVLYQIAFRKRHTPRFYTWLVAKPVVGMALGAIVYSWSSAENWH